MKQAVDFLNSLAQALSAMRLYGEKHTARHRAISRAYDAVLDLLRHRHDSAFSILDGEVIFANEHLRELKAWKWTRPLARAGVERLEIQPGVPRDEFERFLTELRQRMDRGSADQTSALELTGKFPHIHFGQLSLDPEKGEGGRGRVAVADLRDETEAVGWMIGEAARKGKVSAAVADAVVRSLALALHEEQNVFQLLLPLRETDEYTTVHSMNVCILSMAIAESLGHGGTFVKAVGEAALLHDVGKTRIPTEVLQKPGDLSAEEWQVIKQHPADGARILVNSSGELELAVVVAYEHHVSWNGGGYPRLRRGRRPHPASQLVQICDIYDALRTRRPFRGPWDSNQIVRHLREQAGTTHDPHAVATFLDLLTRWEAAGAPGENGSGGADLPSL